MHSNSNKNTLSQKGNCSRIKIILISYFLLTVLFSWICRYIRVRQIVFRVVSLSFVYNLQNRKVFMSYFHDSRKTTERDTFKIISFCEYVVEHLFLLHFCLFFCVNIYNFSVVHVNGIYAGWKKPHGSKRYLKYC